MHFSTDRSSFHIYLIKPTHYDGAGDPIIWSRALIPSNSLAVLNGLCVDFRERQGLGPGVDIQIQVIDESHTRVVPERIARRILRSGARGFVGMVGVQTNQFPRALDLSDRFAACGVPVCIGGFHVSGYFATMKTLPPEICDAQQRGISFFLGEAEGGRIDEVLADAYGGTLRPTYNYMGQQPDIGGVPQPVLPVREIRKSYGQYAPFDLGRGCPFACTFCTIINVHGQQSRFRTADDLENIIRDNCVRGVRQFFLTDDNVARNANWKAFFNRLQQLRREGLRFRILAQVDTACHRIEEFIPRAVAAGIDQILVGLESVNPQNLKHIQKRQNKIDEYRQNLQAWKRFPVVITASYIIGFPDDTPQSVQRDVAILKRELPIDAIYFTVLTPLPGSVMHRDMCERGEWLASDYNQYDTHHCVLQHPGMSTAEWQRAYRAAWESFYTLSHMETILRRMVACGSNKKLTTIYRLVVNSQFGIHSTIHPIDAGLVRKRYRDDRRPGVPADSWLRFYLNHWREVIGFTWRFYRLSRRLWRFWKQLSRDAGAHRYTDAAIEGIERKTPRQVKYQLSPDKKKQKTVLQKS